MASQKIDERNKRYIAIIEAFRDQLPHVSGKMDVGLDDADVVDVRVRVSPAYRRWLAENQGRDVYSVQFQNQGLMFAPGKHAVEHVITVTVGIVVQLLEKDVPHKVAIGLLPEELAAMVHREYQKLYA